MIRRFKTDFKGMRNLLKRQQMGDFFCRPVASVLKVGGGDRLKQKFLTAKKKEKIGSKIMTFLIRNVMGAVLLFILFLIA